MKTLQIPTTPLMSRSGWSAFWVALLAHLSGPSSWMCR